MYLVCLNTDEPTLDCAIGVNTNLSSAGRTDSGPPGLPGSSRPAQLPGTSSGRRRPRRHTGPADGRGGAAEIHAGLV